MMSQKNLKKIFGFLGYILLSLTLVASVSCVEEKQGKESADCAEGQDFNTVSRDCRNVSSSPSPLLESLVFDEDDKETFTLNYKDSEGLNATRCDITLDSADFYTIRAPEYDNAVSRAESVYNKAEDAYLAINDPAASSAAEEEKDDALFGLNEARAAQNTSEMEAALLIVLSNAKDAAEIAIDTDEPFASAEGQDALNVANDLEVFHQRIVDRCSCNGGICEAVYVGDENEYGDGGFSYSLEDSDGVSNTKSVSVIAKSVNDKPIPAYAHHVKIESPTASGSTYDVDVPFAEDIDDPFPSLFDYEITSPPAKGTLNPSCLTPMGGDLDCQYTPTDGNESGSGSFAADNNFSGLDIEANAQGTWGNNITLTIKEHPINRMGNKNGSGGENNVKIEVEGFDITAWVETDSESVDTDGDGVDDDFYTPTTKQNLRDALNNDSYASQLIDVTTAGSSVAIGSTTLSGGANSYDQFSYSVYDGSGESVVDGVVSIQIDPQNDDPIASNFTVTCDESSSATPVTCTSTVSYPATDAEDDGDLLTYNFPSGGGASEGTVSNFNKDTTDNEISFDYDPNDGDENDDNAPFPDTFDYTVTDTDGATSNTGTVTVEMTPQNDPPRVTDLSATCTESGTSQPTACEVEFSIGDDGTYDVHDVDDDISDLSFDIPDTGNTPSKGSISNVNVDTGLQKVTFDYTPDDGNAYGGSPFDSFDYKVSDDDNDSDTGTIEITMNGTDDKPFICEVSTFNDFTSDEKYAPECGQKGCYLSESPVGNVTPTKDGVVYFSTDTQVCYMSDSSQDGDNSDLSDEDWKIVNNSIFDITVNEGVREIYIPNVYVDEGGGGAGEDGDGITLSNISSSNTSLIPTNQVKFIDVNGNVQGAGDSFGDGADNASDQPFEILVKPAAPQTGTSTITLDIEDGSNTTQVSFDVTVEPSSIQHIAWSNIKALGPKISTEPSGNKNIESPSFCPYSRMKCQDDQGNRVDCECQGSPGSDKLDCDNTSVPDSSTWHGDISDATNLVFHNNENNKCYYYDGSAWTEFTEPIHCPITSSDIETNCNGHSCIRTSGPAGDIEPTHEGSSVYDVDNNTCYRSRNSVDAAPNTWSDTDWESYEGTAEVTLSWDDFEVIGSGSVSGYEIYRRTHEESFKDTNPINRELVPVSQNTYVDNVENSHDPPVPGTVYYYEVRPVLDGVVTETQEHDKEIRVIAPPANMAFVHRWIVNREMCQMMNKSIEDNEIQTGSNYICDYYGPGNTSSSYDFGEDLLVDRFEASCNYSKSSKCDTTSGDCVGTEDPAGSVRHFEADAVFYDRSTGDCYEATGGAGANGWSPVSNALPTGHDHREPRNPPIVNIDQADSSAFCTNASNDVGDISGVSTGTSNGSELPDRFSQMALSLWSDDLSDSEINTLETGFALNSSSKCNASEADGFEGYYTNTDTVTTSNSFTIPGTKDSEIRSVETGSDLTEQCQSRFGIQDVVGNVAEWTRDALDCRGVTQGDSGLSTCTGVAGTAATFDASGAGTTEFDNYYLDGRVGPCRDINGDGFCDQALSSWTIDNESFNAGRWVIPLGLPVDIDFPSILDDPDDPAEPSTVEIGPSSGITSSKLHQDEVIFDTQNAFSETDGQGFLTTGGGYKSGQGAGRWSLEMLPKTTATNNYAQIGQVAFRDVSGGTIESIEIIADDGTPPAPFDCRIVGGTKMQIEILSGTTTWQNLISGLNGDPNCNGEVDAYESGNITSDATTTSSPVDLEVINEPEKRDDVGFRCVTPIDWISYD